MLRLDTDCLHAETPLQKPASSVSEESKSHVSDPGVSCGDNYWPIIAHVWQKNLWGELKEVMLPYCGPFGE